MGDGEVRVRGQGNARELGERERRKRRVQRAHVNNSFQLKWMTYQLYSLVHPAEFESDYQLNQLERVAVG